MLFYISEPDSSKLAVPYELLKVLYNNDPSEQLQRFGLLAVFGSSVELSIEISSPLTIWKKNCFFILFLRYQDFHSQSLLFEMFASFPIVFKVLKRKEIAIVTIILIIFTVNILFVNSTHFFEVEWCWNIVHIWETASQGVSNLVSPQMHVNIIVKKGLKIRKKQDMTNRVIYRPNT